MSYFLRLRASLIAGLSLVSLFMYPTSSYSVEAWSFWDITTLENEAWPIVDVSWEYIGEEPSLAILPNGHPAVSYHAGSPYYDLKFAWFDGQSWHRETIDADGKIGRGSSLAILPSGHPAISYIDSTNHALKYSWYDGSTWVITAVPGSGGLQGVTSLVIRSDGYPTILYFDTTQDQLLCAFQDTEGWHLESVTNAGASSGELSGQLLPSGEIAVAYYDASNGCLKYSWSADSEWHTGIVDDTGDVGRYCNLALLASGAPAISYCDATTLQLRLAQRDGEAWQLAVVDEDIRLGRTDLDVLPNGDTIIVYSGTPTMTSGNWHSELRYAHLRSHEWTIGTVDDLGQCRDGTLAILPSGLPVIAYYRWASTFGSPMLALPSVFDVAPVSVQVEFTAHAEVDAGCGVVSDSQQDAAVEARTECDLDPPRQGGITHAFTFISDDDTPGGHIRWRAILEGKGGRRCVEYDDWSGECMLYVNTESQSSGIVSGTLQIGESVSCPAGTPLTMNVAVLGRGNSGTSGDRLLTVYRAEEEVARLGGGGRLENVTVYAGESLAYEFSVSVSSVADDWLKRDWAHDLRYEWRFVFTDAPTAMDGGDLAVQGVEVDSTLRAGYAAHVEWEIANLSDSLGVPGGFTDAIYLSRDAKWDIGDTLLAEKKHDQPLLPGERRAGAVDFTVPGALPGLYHLLIRTDAYEQVDESGSEENNLGASLPVPLEVDSLTVGAEVESLFEGSGASRYYKVTCESGRDLQIRLIDEDQVGFNELYVSHEAIPTRARFGYRGVASLSANKRVHVPDTQDGDYYILAYASYAGENPPSHFLLGTGYLPFGISEILPDRLPNNTPHPMPLTIRGAGFADDMHACLRREGHTDIESASLECLGTSIAIASFQLDGAAAGIWELLLRRGDTSEATAPITLSADLSAELEAHLMIPPVMGPDRPATLYIEYQNTGTVPMSVPLFSVEAEEGTFLTADSDFLAVTHGLSPSLWALRNTVEILARGEEPTPLVLQPGDSGRMPIYYQGLAQPFDPGRQELSFTLGILHAENDTPIDWEHVASQIRREGVDPLVWQEALSRLQQYIGFTWGDYVDALIDRAATRRQYDTACFVVDTLINDLFESARPDRSGPIVGRVMLDGQEAAVTDTRIILAASEGPEERATITNNDGYFYFNSVEAGEYRFRIEHFTITSDAILIVAPDQGFTEVSLNAVAMASLSGAVSDQTLSPLSEASLIASNTQGQCYSGQTDGAGRFVLTDISAGTYDLTCKYGDFVSETVRDLVVTAGSDVIGIDFRLVRGGEVRGTVNMDLGPLPFPLPLSVPYASVSLLAQNNVSLETTADATGAFSLNGVPPGSCSVVARASEYVSSRYSAIQVTAHETTRVDFVLQLASGISGTITDGANRPVVDAVVTASSSSWSSSTSSDDAGTYSLDDLPPGSYRVRVRANGYGQMESDEIELAPYDHHQAVDFTLEPNDTLRGIVTEEGSGAPVTDARIELLLENGIGQLMTSDQNGEFGLQALPPGTYLMRVTARGFIGTQRMLELQAGQVWPTVNLSLSRGAVISGHVYRSDGQTPLAGALVQLLDEQGKRVVSTFTDSAGEYLLDAVRDGNYTIAVRHIHHGFSDTDVALIDATDLVHDCAASSNTLAGTVTSGADGSAVSQARIAVFDEGELGKGACLFTSSSAEGGFVLPSITSGDYLVVVEAPGFGRRTVSVEVLDSSTPPLDIALASPMSVTGRVTSAVTGAPIEGALVWAFDSAHAAIDPGVQAITDADGQYEISAVSEGLHLLCTQAAGYALSCSEIMVGPGTSHPISLTQGDASLAVVVQEAASSIPLKGAQVWMWREGETPLQGLTDSTGTCTFWGLAEGQYRIAALLYDTGNWATVTVSGAVSQVLHLDMQESIPCADPFRGLAGSGLMFPERASAQTPKDTAQAFVNARILTNSDTQSGLAQDVRLWVSAADDSLGRLRNSKHGLYLDEQGHLLIPSEPEPIEPVGYAGLTEQRAQLIYDYADLLGLAEGLENRIKSWKKAVDQAQQIRDQMISSRNVLAQGTTLLVGLAAIYPTGCTVALSDDPLQWAGASMQDVLISSLGPSGSALGAASTLWGLEDRLEEIEGWGDILESHVRSQGMQLENTLSYLWAEKQRLARDLAEYVRSAEAYKGKFASYVNNYHETVDRLPKQRPEADTTECGTSTAGIVRAVDPNDKVGPSGFGTGGFIRSDAPMVYTVYFENEPEANAAAAAVHLTDVLDPNLDWGSLELLEVRFGRHFFEVPAGVSTLEETFGVDLWTWDPNAGWDTTREMLQTTLRAELDVPSGALIWQIVGVDPNTGWPPSDPYAGFLPPNDVSGESRRGCGQVCFRVFPSADLPTGMRIENSASIVFDANEAIETPLISHVIDAGMPYSAVNPLPPQVTSPFRVEWAGEDDANGSGIASYEVFVAVDGSAPQLWATTSDYSLEFSGDPGHEYAFYTIAIDNVGHREEPPVTPDAVTEIVPSGGPTDISDLVSLQLSGLRFDRRNMHSYVQFELANSFSQVIEGPLWVVLDAISPDTVALASADGCTDSGLPYLDLSSHLIDGQLEPGQLLQGQVAFHNPERVGFAADISVYGVVGNLPSLHLEHFCIGDTCVEDTVPPTIISAVSRKSGVQGAALDLPLTLDVQSPTTESRADDAVCLVITFSEEVMPTDGVWDGTEVLLSSGILDSVSVLGQDMTIVGSGLSEPACITVTLVQVVDQAGNPLAGTKVVQLRLLPGDTNGDGETNYIDVAQVKSLVGQPASANPSADCNSDGVINYIDVAAVKSRAGASVECP